MTVLVKYPHIEVDEQGRPHIEGRRITVAHIVVEHIHHNEPLQSICEDYDLLPAQVHAAMMYYYDHKDDIERAIHDEGREVAVLVRGMNRTS
jgi:uncharacterized protein (DUF433 family)